MNKLILLILITFISLVSCDGRDRAYQTNAEVLKVHQLLDSFSERVEYVPKKYTTVVTDTILSNGFKIKITAYIDMENAVLKIAHSEALKHKTYFRNRKAEITVEKNHKLLFSKIIDNDFFIKMNPLLKDSLKDYIIAEAYTEYDASFIKNKINFIFVFSNPLNHKTRSFTLSIHELGNYHVEENNIL